MSAPEDHFDVEPMPEDESKPREWWIRECPHMPLKIYNKLSDTQEHSEIQKCCTLFHAIEHSALVEAKEEIEVIKKERREFGEMYVKCEFKWLDLFEKQKEEIAFLEKDQIRNDHILKSEDQELQRCLDGGKK